MLQANSKAEFLEGLAAMGPMKMKFEMLKQFEDGSEVCSIYNFLVGNTPVLMISNAQPHWLALIPSVERLLSLLRRRSSKLH